jgi:plasmid stabilization system protein ParE
MNVRMTATARLHILAIGEYLEGNFGPAVAQKLRLRVADFAERIAQSPFLYPPAESPLTAFQKAVLHPNLLAIYHVNEPQKLVTIIGFMDTRQDYQTWAAALPPDDLP